VRERRPDALEASEGGAPADGVVVSAATVPAPSSEAIVEVGAAEGTTPQTVAARPTSRRRRSGEAARPAGETRAPAAAGSGAQPRRRDVRRPKAIVRQDEGSGMGPALSTEPAARRQGIVAEQPERKTILVSDDGRELRVALIEDTRLAEIYIERPEKKSYLGDIYQGKVESVLNGIDAAFVDFGLEKNGFLYVDDVVTPDGEKRARRIADALKPGQQVLVQVTKDPMGSKGARLNTKISLAGRYLVYVPNGSGVGVSRRLRPGERDRLRDICKELKVKNAGLIVRTIAEGHDFEDLKRDLSFLSRLWTRLKKKAETVSAPGLVHKEADVSLEVARDLFNDSVETMVVDDAKRHKALLSFLTKVAPELVPKVQKYEGEEPLFEAYGVEEQIARALERRVLLPSGGNLVIDHAEALTVIDVNTGRFTRGKGLEDTITKTNLEAAREAVRQLRLRDIGGIIIIDFIDMAHAKNRETVLETLEAELEMDRTKTYVVELSPLGLVEMTRQNTTDGARGILTRPCPTCLGKARVPSEETMALSAERRVRALARKSQAKAWLIEVNAGVAERLSGDRLKRLEKQTGRRIFFEGAGGLPVDAFRMLAEGAVEHVQSQRVPVREGQEVEIELEFSLSYSPRDAVGYVNGYMVVVEGGQPFLGQKRAVRITATARTGGQGTVLKVG
jgi:ribonuclease G